MLLLKKRSLRVAFGSAGTVLAATVLLAPHIRNSHIFFPSGEKHLRELGLDPALVRKLTDLPVRVRVKTAFGRTHIVITNLMKKNAREKDDDSIPLDAYTRISSGACLVTMPAAAFSASDFISFFHHIPKKLLAADKISPQEMRALVTLHEIRHCFMQNRLLDATYSEADADYMAITLAEEHFKNPHIRKVWLAFRALDLSTKKHSIGLELDYMLAGKPLPDAAAARQSLKETYDLIMKYRHQGESRDTTRWWNEDTSGNLIVWRNDYTGAQLALEREMNLNPHTRRRLQLFIEAVDTLIVPDRKPQDPTISPAPR